MKTRCRNGRILLVLLAALMMGLLPAAPASAFGRITQVTAEVQGGQIPPLVAQRMRDSVQVIAEQVVMGRPIADRYPQEEQLIHEVFDKVLVGYTVQSVSIHADGEAAAVSVALLPWDDTVSRVAVDTRIEGMPPEVEALVRQDLQSVETVFDDALLGLPVAATDWTNGVLKHHLNDWLAAHLPEFRADFDLEPAGDGVMHVHLTVFPRLPVVRTTDLSMRSDTVPNFTLLSHRERVQQTADLLVGVPVAFVERHKEAFESLIAHSLDDLPDSRQIRLQSQVTIDSGERLHIMCRSNTRYFRLRLTGWLDIGRKDNSDHDLMFRLHGGHMLSSRDELFALLDVYPQDVDWDWQLGVRHALSSRGDGELRYDMRGKRFLFGVRQQLYPRWWIRYEYRCLGRIGETAVGYKLHDFLSLELARDRQDDWLRLIGNF